MVVTDDNWCPSTITTTVFRAGAAQGGVWTPSDVVIESVRPSLRLLAGVVQPLLVPEEECLPLVLDLGLGIVNGIGIIDVQGDGLALAFAPSDHHNSGGAAFGCGAGKGTLCRQRWSVVCFWMS